MKRSLIAILLSLSLAAGTFGATPIYAAEAAAQEGITENEQSGASVPSEDDSSKSGKEEAAEEASSQSVAGESVENDSVGGEEQTTSDEIMESYNGNPEESGGNENAEEGLSDEEAGNAATVVDTEIAAVVEPTVESTEGKEAALAGETGDVVASGSCGTYATWTLTGTGDNLTLTISGSGDMFDYSSNSRIPWYDYRDSIKNVTIEDGITSFHKNSFSHYGSIESVFLPNSLTSIGDYAFYGCTNLENITMPEQLNEIGSSAFGNCRSLTCIYIPNGVVRLSSTFSGCSSLESVTIPEGVSELNGTFSDCTALLSVAFPDGLTSLGGNTFSGCTSLKSIVLPEGITSLDGANFYNCSSLENIELPNTLVEIGGQSFAGCSSLTSIDIPSGVIKIGNDAFSGCSALAGLIIPDGVTQIGSGAFSNCTSLDNIDLPDGITEIGNQAFFKCENLTSIVIPDGVTEIGAYTFNGCKNLTSVLLPEGLFSIGDGAFAQCNSLKGIAFPERVNTIGDYAFSGCTSLSSISLPTGLTHINENAFSACTGLEEIEFPDDLESIGNSAFYGCRNLTELVFPEGMSSIGSYAFRSCYDLIRITVPGSVTNIDETAFYDDSRIRECYTVPGSYISTHVPKYNSYNTNIVIKYLCDESPTEYHHIGFISDTICTEVGETVSLGDYMVSDYAISECLVTLSNENTFVYDDGMIASFGTGECEITVSKGDITSTVKVIAQDAPVGGAESITFSDSVMTMVKGQTVANTLIVTPSNSNINGFIWVSSDDSVLSVIDGRITAVSAGEATIAVTDPENPDVHAECVINVIVPLNDIIINESTLRIEKGKTLRIKLYKYPSDATDEISYSSSDSEIAEVGQDGIINAINFGNTVIAIQSGSITKEIEVQVFRPLSSISLDINNTRLLAGESLQLNVSFYPEDATETSVIWESSKESVATVDEFGLVTAHGKGIAKITATAGNYSAYCTIICPDVPMTGIELPENQVIGYGEEYTPSIVYFPSTTTDDKTATWESSDPDIFTVSEEGIVTPTGIGTATLTATVSEFSATSEITVVKGTPEYETPEAINAVCGQILTELELPEGFEWNDAEQGVGNAGSNSFIVFFTPEDTDHYNTIGNITVVVNVSHEYAEEWTEGDDTHWHECACGEKADETEHIYGEWEVTTEPTCTESGEKQRICLECGHVDKDTIAAKGHDWFADYTVDAEATCIDTGEKSIYCKDCGEKKEDSTVEIPGLGHAYAEKVIQPTCSQGGFTMHICGRCGEYYEDNETQPTGHTFGDWIIDNDSTCTEEGIQHRECEDCGYIETKGIDKKEHSFDTEYTVDKEPTCTTDGSKSYHCTSEGCTATTSSEVIPAIGHDYSDWTVTREATCTENGEMERTCEVCDETETVEFGARGHVWLKIPTVDLEATCTEEGSESVRCAVCDEIKEGSERVIPAKGHMLIHVEAVEPTYESDGSIEYYRCEQCSLLFEDENCENEIRVEDTVIPALEWISVSQVSLDKNEITINRSVKEQLEATVSPESATDKRVIWESSDENVAKVDENGEVTGIGFGDAVITVTAEDGGISAQCTVHVVSRIRIVTQPADRTAMLGERVCFNVEAEGEGLVYQWQYSTNGSTWRNCTAAGYNSPEFSFEMASSYDGRQYRCRVKSGTETAYSGAATAILKNAVTIIADPVDTEVKAGETAVFTVEAEGEGLVYQWQYSTNGSTWRNCTAAGYNNPEFSFKMAESYDGRQYRCRVKSGTETAYSGAATAILKNAVTIIADPADAEVNVGETAVFTVEAEGEELSYQWQWSTNGSTWKNCTNQGYNTEEFSFTVKATYSGRKYRCRVTSGTEKAYTKAAELVVILNQ